MYDSPLQTEDAHCFGTLAVEPWQGRHRLRETCRSGAGAEETCSVGAAGAAEFESRAAAAVVAGAVAGDVAAAAAAAAAGDVAGYREWGSPMRIAGESQRRWAVGVAASSAAVGGCRSVSWGT